MYLHELLVDYVVDASEQEGSSSMIPLDVELLDMVADSRQITQGCVFVAQKGLMVDARDYISRAVDSGAVAVIYEQDGLSSAQSELIESLDIPSVAISGLNNEIGYLSAKFFNHPAEKMKVFGITGTNGKTSSAYLLTQSLQLLGHKAAFIGTIGVGQIGALQPVTHTTADSITLQRQFAELVQQGYSHVCMEVSSHALDQGRVNGVEFYAALFTNLSHDHLDYHGSMEVYAAAKQRLFTDFSLKFAVTNCDDEFGVQLLDVASVEFMSSYGDAGDVRADDIRADKDGLVFTIDTDAFDFDVRSSLVGLINVPNILLVVTTLLVLGVDVADIQRLVPQLESAPGRMEVFSQDDSPVVVVDFAHTPDALERALLSVREHCAGDLWCVFGCGGDRDRQKRPEMGAVVERCADAMVLTNDNPRSETAATIFADITQGMQRKATIIEDRGMAIEWAIKQAGPQDWILVAGKGHEQYQIIGNEKRDFSDRDWVVQCLGVAA
ncbi:MAG: UDP-N-acetylmuramoyl-L-alanyl-D-glutamate--2,6-diaminopimelate ligase [Arenicella sp.]